MLANEASVDARTRTKNIRKKQQRECQREPERIEGKRLMVIDDDGGEIDRIGDVVVDQLDLQAPNGA